MDIDRDTTRLSDLPLSVCGMSLVDWGRCIINGNSDDMATRVQYPSPGQSRLSGQTPVVREWDARRRKSGG